MTCVMFGDGFRQEIDEEVFNQMAELLHQTDKEEPAVPEGLKRLKMMELMTRDPTTQLLFKYYQKNLKEPFKCPDCGRTISSKTSLSKHRQTKVCEKHRHH